MSVDPDSATGEPLYRLSGNAGQRTIPRQNVIHLRAPGCTGIKGDSPVTQCREAIALALILESHAATFFGRGGRPDGLLTTDEKLGEAAASRMGKAWKATFGSGRSGGTPVLENGLKYQALSLNSVDSQFLELREFAVTEIARAFRVPPHLLYQMGRQTWANVGEMGRVFLQYSLMPWLSRWEGELNLKLFAGEERGSYFVEFLTDALVRSDLAARADAYQKLIASRVLNPNQARARENLPPYQGGDKYENPNTTTGTAK